MTDTFEFTLNNPLTEEQWDMIEDVDFDRTDNITIHTKHGKEVEFAKVRHGKWIPKILKFGGRDYVAGMKCSACGEDALETEGDEYLTDYCPNCGCKMDADRREE